MHMYVCRLLPPLFHSIPAPDLQATMVECGNPGTRMQMDTAHARFGHRAHRSLLCGSLHHVWDDYLIIPASDDYCEGCKTAASRSAPRSQRGAPTPHRPFERIFIDITPSPADDSGLTKDTTFPCHLLIVDRFSRFTWFEGMNNYTSQEVIRCLKQFMVETRRLSSAKSKSNQQPSY